MNSPNIEIDNYENQTYPIHLQNEIEDRSQNNITENKNAELNKTEEQNNQKHFGSKSIRKFFKKNQKQKCSLKSSQKKNKKNENKNFKFYSTPSDGIDVCYISYDPSSRNIPLRGKLIFSYGLSIVCLFLLLAEFIVGNGFVRLSENPMWGPSAESLMKMGAMNHDSVVNGNFWRIFWAPFLHAGVFHYVMNFILWIKMGPLIEPDWGFWKVLTVYMGGAVTGNLLSVTLDNDSVSMGASGGMFGIMSGILIYILEYSETIPNANLTFWTIFVSVLIGLGCSFMPHVDAYVHTGGAIGGFLTSCILMRECQMNLKNLFMCRSDTEQNEPIMIHIDQLDNNNNNNNNDNIDIKIKINNNNNNLKLKNNRPCKWINAAEFGSSPPSYCNSPFQQSDENDVDDEYKNYSPSEYSPVLKSDQEFGFEIRIDNQIKNKKNKNNNNPFSSPQVSKSSPSSVIPQKNKKRKLFKKNLAIEEATPLTDDMYWSDDVQEFEKNKITNKINFKKIYDLESPSGNNRFAQFVDDHSFGRSPPPVFENSNNIESQSSKLENENVDSNKESDQKFSFWRNQFNIYKSRWMANPSEVYSTTFPGLFKINGRSHFIFCGGRINPNRISKGIKNVPCDENGDSLLFVSHVVVNASAIRSSLRHTGKLLLNDRVDWRSKKIWSFRISGFVLLAVFWFTLLYFLLICPECYTPPGQVVTR